METIFIKAAIALGGAGLALKFYRWATSKMKKLPQNENPYVEAEDLKAKYGEIIEFDYDSHKHYGIYDGKGNIIHFVCDGTNKGFIKSEMLTKVAKNILCRVNNLTEAAKRRNLCAKSDGKIYDATQDKLNKKIKHDGSKYDCELFATEIRYGKKFSEQPDIVKEDPEINTIPQTIISNELQK